MLEKAQAFAAGDRVIVIESFTGDDEEGPLELRETIEGIVQEVDEDGDLRIDFMPLDGEPFGQWVCQHHFGKLKVVEKAALLPSSARVSGVCGWGCTCNTDLGVSGSGGICHQGARAQYAEPRTRPMHVITPWHHTRNEAGQTRWVLQKILCRKVSHVAG